MTRTSNLDELKCEKIDLKRKIDMLLSEFSHKHGVRIDVDVNVTEMKAEESNGSVYFTYSTDIKITL